MNYSTIEVTGNVKLASGGGTINAMWGQITGDIDDQTDLIEKFDAIVIPTKTSDLVNDSGFITSVPVLSVNGQTGAVVLTIPTNTSDLVNDSGFITSVPVLSVNSQTGAVVLTASDVNALPSNTTYVSSVNGLSGAVSGLQTTSNLVTSVSSSSTDTQYPSAKCLYDLVGDIETLLSAI